MTPRDHAHELIDRLPEPQVTALVGLLESMVETTLGSAEWDDEPETESERVAVADAKHPCRKTEASPTPTPCAA